LFTDEPPEFHVQPLLVLLVDDVEVLFPVTGVGALFLVHGGADCGTAVQRLSASLHRRAAFERGGQQVLDSRTVGLHPLINANDNARHLAAVFLGGHDGDQATLFLGHGHVAGRPGDNTVHGDALPFAGAAAVADHGPNLGIAGHVLFGGVNVVVGGHPVERVGS
jgi:hypothetical protein